MAKVLLVEDDNNLREIFEMRLQAEGYQTVTAGNGEEGLTVAMKEKPDLIIADVMMPKLSGFDMLENLRAAPETKNTKVIMMTALGQAEDRARGESLGVVKYLVKSQATLEDFAAVVRGVLPPDGGSAQPKADASQNNKQESEQSMQEDSTPTNPPMPGADAGAPMTNPVTGDSAAADPTSTDQQSAAQEQTAVDDQINSFVASPTPASDTPMPSAPATPPTYTPPTDNSSTPFADTSSTPPPDFSAPSAPATPEMDAGTAPAIPPATPPADTPPAVPPTEPIDDPANNAI